MTNNKIASEIYILKTTRERIVDILNKFNVDQLNTIPVPFKNNLIWNAAHCLVTQNLLTYGRASFPIPLSTDIVETYRKGAKPGAPVSIDFVNDIKEQLLASPQLLSETYANGELNNYEAYSTSYGVELKSIEDAIAFNNTHEGLHLGVMMSISKFV